MESIEGACSDFGDDKRLVPESFLSIDPGGFLLHEGCDLSSCGILSGGPDPSGVHVEGDDVCEFQTEIVVEMTAGEGNESGRVFLAHGVGDFPVAWDGFLLFGVAFIEECDDDDGRIVDGNSCHDSAVFDESIKMLFDGIRFESPPDGFMPDEESHLIAEIQESLILWIVDASDEVGSEELQGLEVFEDQMFVLDGSEFGVALMAVDAEQADRFSIEENFLFFRLHGPDSETFHDAVSGNGNAREM